MSALRLEVEVHIVTGAATAVQNLSKCVKRGRRQDRRARRRPLASADAVLSETEKELGVAVADIGAGTIDLAMFVDGSPFRTARPADRRQQRHQRRRARPEDEPPGRRGAEDPRTGRATSRRSTTTRRSPSACSARTPAGRSAARAVRDHRGPDARDVRADADRDGPRRARDAAGRDHPDRRRRRSWPVPPSSAREVLGMPVRIAAPAGDRRAGRHDPDPGLRDRGRAAPVGRLDPGRGRADALRVGAGDGRASAGSGTPSAASSPDPPNARERGGRAPLAVRPRAIGRSLIADPLTQRYTRPTSSERALFPPDRQTPGCEPTEERRCRCDPTPRTSP